MLTNSNLHNAKSKKNDEFYTTLEAIEAELQHYNLKGKSIYSPADDYRFSNFVKYFVDNFKKLGLKKFCATNYDIGNGAYKYEYDGVNATITKLEGNGDFRSEECTKIRDEYDVIVTNPPFSLFDKFIEWAITKNLIVIGNQNSAAHKHIFPLFKENKLWIGVTSNGNQMYFIVNEDTYDVKNAIIKKVDNTTQIAVNGIFWYTNLPNGKHHILQLEKNNQPEEYLDNGFRNVNKMKYIPEDDNDVIAVPPTIVKYIDNEGNILTTNGKYKLIGISHTLKDLSVYDYGYPKVNGKLKYARILIQKITY